MRSRHYAALLVVTGYLVQACLAGAAVGPYGPIFPANGLTTQDSSWATSCVDARGVTTTVLERCGQSVCNDAVRVFFERRSADGVVVTQRTKVSENRAVSGYSTITCADDGSFAITWLDESTHCYFIRIYDGNGAALGNGFHLGGEQVCPSSDHPTLLVYPDDSVLAIWAVRPVEERNDLVARRFNSDGTPIGTPVVLNEPVRGWNSTPSADVDGSGSALIAWPYDLDDVDTIYARVLDPSGRPVTDVFSVTPSATYFYLSSVAVRADGDGLFRVLWNDPDLGGTVGRGVALDLASAPSTTTTTLPRPADFPDFAPPKVVMSTTSRRGGLWDVVEIHDGDGAAWYVRLREWLVGTLDEGRRWLLPVASGGDPYGPIASVTDGRGVWTALHNLGYVSEMSASRSYDDGRTWTEPIPVATWPHISRDCDNCYVLDAEIGVDASGTMVAAWGFRDWEDEWWSDDGTVESVSRMYAVTSRDGGETWGSPVVVAEPTYPQSMKLATDGRGTWVLAWATNYGILTARSADGGTSWSAPTVVIYEFAENLDVAADAAGRWILVFDAFYLDPSRYGDDSDVFSLRSTDDGRSWGDLRAVNLYATTDRSTDVDPSIATDGRGKWVVLWAAHHPLDAAVGLDGDILGAVSRDNGRTWGPPAVVDPSARTDAVRDVGPEIFVDDRGVWAATWQAKQTVRPYEDTDDRVLFAVAGDRCGDGTVEIGEECDDGNPTEGDGCDTNCTATACGNTIVSAGEACDDGNSSNADDCVAECGVAVCGDGYLREGVEECDDGNRSNTDGCVGFCRLARCGDGYRRDGIEECDDGNLASNDGCPENCRSAVCGDGYVRTGIEECDDGNRFDDDGCVAGCYEATCGDGYVRFGVEVCDPGDPIQNPTCSRDCGVTNGCGDADYSGSVVVDDARKILLAAVGLGQACPLEACDLDGNGGVSVIDAFLALNSALGLDVELRCPSPRRVVFYLAGPAKLGALRFDVHYDPGVVAFSTDDVPHTCMALAAGTYTAFNDRPDVATLATGLVSLSGVQGPRDLARCGYLARAESGPPTFAIEVLDASSPDLTTLWPYPRIGYRFE